MQQTVALPIIFIGIYVIITLLVAIFPFGRHRFQTIGDFHAASGGMGFWVISISTLVSFYSGTTWTGWQGFISESGALGAYVFPFIATSGVIFYFLSEKIQPVAKEKQLITIGDYLDIKFRNRPVKIIAACISLLTSIVWIVMDVTTMGYVFNVVTQNKIPLFYSELIALIIILIYVLWGGIESIVWTDLLQGIIMLVGGTFVCYYIVTYYFGDVGTLSYQFEKAISNNYLTLSASPDAQISQEWFSLILVSSLAAICFPATFVRMYMGKDINVLRKTGIFLALTALWSLVYYIPGIAATILPGVNEDRQASLLKMITDTGDILVICFTSVFIIAVCIGTIDILLLTSALTLSKDILGELSKGKMGEDLQDERRQVFYIRISVIGIASFVFFMSIINRFGLFDIAVISTEYMVQLFPVLAGAAYWEKSSGKGALWGLTAGASLVTILVAGGINAFGMLPGFWGLILNTVIFILMSANRKEGTKGRDGATNLTH